MMGFLHHLFLPSKDNNYRSYLLHHKNLLLAIIFLLLGSFASSLARTNLPSVLGVSTNITSENLLVLTNKAREENKVAPLALSPQLSEAAAKKAKDMFDKNYWAHNSPDGTTPWVFIKNSGYNYTYAGENLARGFSETPDVLSAWMASPTHRENILSPNYKDIGFAIKTGILNEEETVLVVEEFGSTSEKTLVSEATSKAVLASPSVVSTPIKKPLLASLPLFSNLNMIIVSLFILVLILDMIVVERKRIVRLVGHNLDHIIFLVLVTLLIYIISKGVII